MCPRQAALTSGWGEDACASIYVCSKLSSVGIRVFPRLWAFLGIAVGAGRRVSLGQSPVGGSLPGCGKWLWTLLIWN